MQTKILASNKPEIAYILDDVDNWQPGVIYKLSSWLESFRETASLKNRLIWTIFFLMILLASTITLNQYDGHSLIIIMFASITLTTAFIPYKFHYIRTNLIKDCYIAILMCLVGYFFVSRLLGEDNMFQDHIKSAYKFARHNFVREYFINNEGIVFLIVLFILGTGFISTVLYLYNKTFSRFCNFFQASIMSFIYVYLFTALITYTILLLTASLGIMNHNALDSNVVLTLIFIVGIPFFVKKEADDKIKKSMKLFEHKWAHYRTGSGLKIILGMMSTSVIMVTLENGQPEFFKGIVVRAEKLTTEGVQVLNIELLFLIFIWFVIHLLVSEYSIDKQHTAKNIS